MFQTSGKSLDSSDLFASVLENISPPSGNNTAAAKQKIDGKTKPLGALGRLEDLALQMSRIQDDLNPSIDRKYLFVFAGDHGITEEGVSAYPSEVTAQMVNNFLTGGAAINVLCRHYQVEMKVVDMGVKKSFVSHPNLAAKKVARGTRNFARENAMTPSQAVQGVENGMTVFIEAAEKHPIQLVGLGEMGIGNTTSASAIIAAITGIPAKEAAGRGTGIDDRGLERKTEVIEKALAFHRPDPTDGLGILQKVGGFEIAGITGAVLAAASKKCAVVLDGVISTAAGLVASVIDPRVKDYLIAGHRSQEVAQQAALAHLGLQPIVDFQMRLGEGTGAVIAMDAVEAACKIMCQMASFEEAQVSESFLESGLPGRQI